MEGALQIHEVCSATAIRIGVEGARMMPKWGIRGKLARIAKRAMEWERYCNKNYEVIEVPQSMDGVAHHYLHYCVDPRALSVEWGASCPPGLINSSDDSKQLGWALQNFL